MLCLLRSGIFESDNNYKNSYTKMFNLKEKQTYRTPHIAVTEMDLEGLICNSVLLNVRVRDLDNVNAGQGLSADDEAEAFYIES